MEQESNNKKREEVYVLIEEHYRKERERYVRFVSKYIQDSTSAEDVVQECYVRACEYWKSYDETVPVGGWIYAILSNCIKEHFNLVYLQGMKLDLPGDAIYSIYSSIRLKEVIIEINKKPSNISRILNLYLVEGYTSYEVAKVVFETAHNVRKIVQRFKEEWK